jgi:hypothetical protein
MGLGKFKQTEVAGYDWVVDAYDRGGWRSNATVDPYNLVDRKVNDQGFAVLTPKENLTLAEKRAYNLAFKGADPFDYNSVLEINEQDLAKPLIVGTGAFNQPFNPLMEYGLSEGSKYFESLKESNPSKYYNLYSNSLTDAIFAGYVTNNYGSVQDQLQALESIKDKDPNAYYTAKLKLLSSQAGWQSGQNTPERAVQQQTEIANIIPDAQRVGLSNEQINSLIGSSFSEASSANQGRIVREATTHGGFNLGEFVRGVAPVVGLAVGGPLIDAALAGSAAAGGAAAAETVPGALSTTGGAGFGTFGSAGAAGTAPGVLSTTGGAGFGTFGTAGAGVAPGVLSTTGGAGFGTLGSAGTTASGFTISPSQAIQGIRSASSLLGGNLFGGGQQQQAPQMQQMGGSMTRIPQGAVDYSGIYNLLALQRPRNPNSLLG